VYAYKCTRPITDRLNARSADGIAAETVEVSITRYSAVHDEPSYAGRDTWVRVGVTPSDQHGSDTLSESWKLTCPAVDRTRILDELQANCEVRHAGKQIVLQIGVRGVKKTWQDIQV